MLKSESQQHWRSHGPVCNIATTVFLSQYALLLSPFVLPHVEVLELEGGGGCNDLHAAETCGMARLCYS
eukprot:2000017-Amphidinium_carterae.1